METRKITIVSTRNQSKKVIMSSATTLAELKSDLRQNGIDYDGMTFFEGTSKVELKNDESVLPHDVPWKGTITNELVFMLTNTNKKIKSGSMSRMEVYAEIKKMGLQDACLKKFGKNFTMCKTVELIALVEENRGPKEEASIASKIASKEEQPAQDNNCVDVAARAAITRMAEILEGNGYLEEYEKEEILDILGGAIFTVPVEDDGQDEPQSESPYSNSEIDDMFNDMDI